jgi:site-specific DNA recombinase
MTLATGVRKAGVYARVSSDDQAQRGTIATQTDALDRRLASEPDLEIVARYIDDGVSGTIPMGQRPGGSLLMRDALAGNIDEVWFLATDRLGRDAPDVLRTRRLLGTLGVRLMTPAGECNPLVTDIEAVIGDYVRVKLLADTARGIDRAARAGRYLGGIVALGLRVDGQKESAHLVPDDGEMWAGLSAAAIVRDIYERLALRGQSCRAIAVDFNALGIPTDYERDGRMVAKVKGQRRERTQNLWRAGRIRNLVVNRVYRGELQYGRRVKKGRPAREVISAPVVPLISPALWDEAQAALTRNRRCAKNTHRVYLLKGVVRCGICGLTYVGSWSKEFGWYRCGGQLVERGPIPGKCLGVSIRTDSIEPAVWADIERFLRDPGDVLDELDGPAEREAQGAIAEAESITLGRALDALESQRKAATALHIRGRLPNDELDAELDRITAERTALEVRVAALEAPRAEIAPQEARDLLAEVRARLDAGLSDEQRQEIVRLLVGIVVQTSVGDNGKKSAKALVTYRFPGVVETRTGIREEVNYTTVRRVIELPVGRRLSPVQAPVPGAS